MLILKGQSQKEKAFCESLGLEIFKILRDAHEKDKLLVTHLDLIKVLVKKLHDLQHSEPKNGFQVIYV